MTERAIATTIHGRYLVVSAETAAPAPLLVGFHGYGEDAQAQMDRLLAIPGSEEWIKVSVSGLHRFYGRKSERVVASWMTRQDRELAIADNLAYVARCLEAVAAEFLTLPRVVFAGFSQGVAMAFRAAVRESERSAGVVAVGGDIPPELTAEELNRLSGAVIARGASDAWYTAEKFAEDGRRLRESAVRVRALEFGGGHEWSPQDYLRS